ncbi:hypothetical protein TU94_03530 [Streptomyces cyaneogriseus subsp. noncyanogenus]|uniref:Uncharacterized protein n=1 Tax=Streptomyces cyaneogriseus subsp. noncyanogenus TaxID=477245 RepID=A0A0C5FW67_9ACTN|nr:hypothetical protein [Streptomyces cyaneogriseus]AJP00700.1 hypothetical protein TU94_03530 [Streptomyces cyaneogriseus subsp. noncyanogenus]
MAAAPSDALSGRLAEALGAPALPLDGADWAAVVPSEPDSSVRVALLLDPAVPACDPATAITRAACRVRDVAAALDTFRDASLWLVLPPTGLFPAPERPQAPEAAALWALGRTVSSEYPAIEVRMVSLERSGDTARDAERLLAEESDRLGVFRRALFSRIAPCVRDIGLWSPDVREAFAALCDGDVRASDLDRLMRQDDEIADTLDARRFAAEETAHAAEIDEMITRGADASR